MGALSRPLETLRFADLITTSQVLKDKRPNQKAVRLQYGSVLCPTTELFLIFAQGG
jgi:hypothetical protein